MVDVSSQSNKVNITVSSSGVSSNINASGDASHYYSEKAKEWAISNRIVDGVDYSSKYYASKSNQSALNAQSFAQSAQDSYNQFQGSVADSLNTIDNKVQEATDNIEIQKQDTITEIQDITTTQKEEIESLSEQEQNKIVDLGIDTRANVDLSNLSNIGNNKFNTILNNKITNCLLEVPQRIKYTLENGTLTIKAGSVVIMPYGVTDRTSEFPIGSTFINNNFKVYDAQYASGKFFVWAELQNDKTISKAGSASGDNTFLCFDLINNGFDYANHTGVESGTDHTTATGYLYYDTTENLIYHRASTSGDWADEILSFPFLTFTRTVGVIDTINQIFNGFGYMGSTVWIDKDVKYLIPNGRNLDGTLNNIEHVTTNIGTLSTSLGNFTSYILLDTSTRAINLRVANNKRYFDSDKNKFIIDGVEYQNTIAGTISVGSERITGMDIKQPFRAIDYNDFKSEVENKLQPLTKAYITETYKNGTSWYRVWSDGWCEQGGIATGGASASGASVTLIKAYKDTNYTLIPAGVDRRTADFQNQAAQIVKIRNVTTTGFYASTSWTATGSYGWEAYPFSWYACGYIS